jgi:hypothetical protein
VSKFLDQLEGNLEAEVSFLKNASREEYDPDEEYGGDTHCQFQERATYLEDALDRWDLDELLDQGVITQEEYDRADNDLHGDWPRD